MQMNSVFIQIQIISLAITTPPKSEASMDVKVENGIKSLFPVLKKVQKSFCTFFLVNPFIYLFFPLDFFYFCVLLFDLMSPNLRGPCVVRLRYTPCYELASDNKRLIINKT